MREKNKYGQYFTEAVIADYMVSLITHDKSASVLKPSCGKGVFLKMLKNRGFDRVSAYEIDKELATGFPQVKFESFVSSPLTEKFDVVIDNSPYILKNNELLMVN